MNEVYILFIIFSLLYLLETKAINKLANYIGLVLIFAILLAFTSSQLEYLSYILILVQISALTILFGFVIMLFGNKPEITLTKIGELPNYYYFSNAVWGILISIIMGSILKINNLNITSFVKQLSEPVLGLKNTLELDSNLNENNFLLTLALALYQDPNNIIKFLLLTLLLFFSILALFFIVKSINNSLISNKQT